MSHKPKRDTAGRTHLHRACQRGAVAEVENILSQGKEFLNEEDNAGYMPLHEACLHGHLDAVKVLMNNGAWVNAPSRLELNTPLQEAVDNGHADVVKYLLELGADPWRRNKQGQTALDANDTNRETPEVFQEIADLLKVGHRRRTKRSSDDEDPRASPAVDSHSSRDPSVASPVHQSPQASSVPTVYRRRKNSRREQSRKDLLWPDAGKDGLQKLRETAREGDQQMVHALLERGTKPDTESLIGAIKGGHTDTVSLLLAYNVIVDPEPGNPGRDGSRKSRDTSIPAGEETPMLAAIGRGNLDVLRYLLENGVDPRRRDSKGKSYVDIAREREGELWEEEVDMLKKAWDKAGGGRESRTDKAGNPSSTHKGSSTKPKKTTDGKTAPSSSRRPNYTSTSSLNPNISPRSSSSTVNPSKYDNTTVVSDHESAAEPRSPPRPQRKLKRSESDYMPPVTAKRKRRLISRKDPAEERPQDTPKPTPTGGGAESKDPKLSSPRPEPTAIEAQRESRRSKFDSMPPVTAKRKRQRISGKDLAEEGSQDIPKSTPTGGGAESKDSKIYLTKEQQAIQNKAREEAEKAREEEVVNLELELRKRRAEAERIEREKREKRGEEERLAREKEANEREVRERIAREAREREIREAKEREGREAWQRYFEEAKSRHQRKIQEERQRERKRQEAREKEARDRKIAEELQRQLAEERRRNEVVTEISRLEEEARQLEIARREALPYALRPAEESPAVLENLKFLPSHRATFNYVGPANNPNPPLPNSTAPEPEAVGVHRAPVREPPAWGFNFIIGTGACGTVFLENVHIPGMKSPELWAVKRIPLGWPKFTFKQYQAEINNSQLLARHEWFIKFNCTYEDTHYIYIAMEYMPMGDMSRSFTDGYRWNEGDTKVVIKQLLHGLAVMHKEGITHRDLKPENIFLYLPENQTHILRVKIGDFGTSKRIPPSNASTYLKTTTGTQGYMAPEVHDTSKPKTNRVDIWSLGCVLHRMFTGNLLFNDAFQVLMYAASPSLLPLDNTGLSTPCVSFLRDILQPIPKNRPSAEDCLKNSWIMSEVLGQEYTIGKDLYTRLSKISHQAPNVHSFPDMVANPAVDSSSVQ